MQIAVRMFTDDRTAADEPAPIPGAIVEVDPVATAVGADPGGEMGYAPMGADLDGEALGGIGEEMGMESLQDGGMDDGLAGVDGGMDDQGGLLAGEDADGF